MPVARVESTSAAAWRRDDRHHTILAGMMWVLVVLMIVPEGFDYEALATTSAPSSGSLISRALWVGLLLLGGLLVCWRLGLAWLLARVLNPFLLCVVALAVASVAWSIDPQLSLRRLVRLGTIVLVCVAFVLVGWHARRYQNVVRPILTLVLLGSIVFALAFPELAIHRDAAAELFGAWHGLTNHKNSFGALACITLILWFHAGLSGEVRPPAAWLGGAVAAASLVLSRSSTAMATTVFVMLLVFGLMRGPRALRPYWPYLIGLLVAMFLLYTLATLRLIPGLGTLVASIALLTDKDTTLTGRTEIWSIMLDHIDYHPLLGTGYAAYWTAGPVAGTESFAFMWRMGAFYPGSAHNGYIDIANDLGWVGLFGLLAYIVAHARQSLQMLSIDRNQAVLYLALLFQQLITNLSESHWFSVLSVNFVLMTLASTALARAQLEQRLRQFFGEPHAIGNPPPQERHSPDAEPAYPSPRGGAV
ncbi:MAG TPA: O-antigen ligase family protein [Burkholderiaceae bacterium]